MKKSMFLLIFCFIVLLTGCAEEMVYDKTFADENLKITLTSNFKEYKKDDDDWQWKYYLEDEDIAFMYTTKFKNLPVSITTEKQREFINALLSPFPGYFPPDEKELAEFCYGDFSLSEYIEYINIGYDAQVYSVTRYPRYRDLYYFYYTTPIRNSSSRYRYMFCVMENKDVFFNINFCCDNDRFADYEATLIKYATSIELIKQETSSEQ